MVPIRHLDHLWYNYCITFTLKKGMCVGELVQSVQIMPVQRKANTGTSAECLWNRLWGNVINFGQNKTFCRRKYISAKWHVQLCICVSSSQTRRTMIQKWLPSIPVDRPQTYSSVIGLYLYRTLSLFTVALMRNITFTRRTIDFNWHAL